MSVIRAPNLPDRVTLTWIAALAILAAVMLMLPSQAE